MKPAGIVLTASPRLGSGALRRLARRPAATARRRSLRVLSRALHGFVARLPSKGRRARIGLTRPGTDITKAPSYERQESNLMNGYQPFAIKPSFVRIRSRNAQPPTPSGAVRAAGPDGLHRLSQKTKSPFGIGRRGS